MRSKPIILAGILALFVYACNQSKGKNSEEQSAKKEETHVRQLIDTIGFAQYQWQLDSIFKRMQPEDKLDTDQNFKAVICPHDDYAYAAGLYNKTLAGIRANTILMIGVAHKARNFSLVNKLVFGSFDQWKSAIGNVKISSLRNELIKELPEDSFVVHDSMMQTEHSLEAIVPFLQKKNSEIQIIPVLVPYMKFEDMQKFSEKLSAALGSLMKEKNMEYGKDLAIVISNDAVHYGDEDWGNSNLAPFGTDSLGNERAHQKDMKIIENDLEGELSLDKIEDFNETTVKQDDFREYAWVWCGRYSVPFGLLTSNKLNNLLVDANLQGELVGYRSSLKNEHIRVDDLGMGTTAPANNHHWVAYVGMGYH